MKKAELEAQIVAMEVIITAAESAADMMWDAFCEAESRRDVAKGELRELREKLAAMGDATP